MSEEQLAEAGRVAALYNPESRGPLTAGETLALLAEVRAGRTGLDRTARFEAMGGKVPPSPRDRAASDMLAALDRLAEVVDREGMSLDAEAAADHARIAITAARAAGIEPTK